MVLKRARRVVFTFEGVLVLGATTGGAECFFRTEGSESKLCFK